MLIESDNLDELVSGLNNIGLNPIVVDKNTNFEEVFAPEFFDDIIEDRTIEDDVRLTNGLENDII